MKLFKEKKLFWEYWGNDLVVFYFINYRMCSFIFEYFNFKRKNRIILDW